jgi:two-component system chemotaxis sensor kinase CheA
MGDDMSAYRDVFLNESAEYLQSISDGLIALEGNPNDTEPVETVFRGAHSLKGMAAAMGYGRTQELTHKMESLMDTVRQRMQAADHTLIDLMLRATDLLKDLIADESSGGASVAIGELVEALVARTEAARPSGEEEAPRVAVDSVDGALLRVAVTLDVECVLKGVRAYMAIKRLSHMGTIVETHPSAREIEDEKFGQTFEVILRTKEPCDAVRAAVRAVSEVADALVEVLETAPASSAAATVASEDPSGRRRAVAKLGETQTVRISIGHLDNMVNLVGELVIIRSRLEKIAREVGGQELLETLAVLQQVSSDLQHEVMQTRMVPVGNIFNRFPRMVRDLARDLGKDVRLEMSGLDIELDRTVLDEIGDPIVHLLRNCVDHGIESGEDRAGRGKPKIGTIRLEAEREREHIRISVSDDGAGMDVDRIWAKAVERGLVDPGARDSFSHHDVLMLICTPGFTTTDQATKVSGRGVGMDVVKGKIEYLGGTVSISSTPGQGSRVSLMLPLTLAIIQALLVGCEEQVFAVPLSAVEEVLGLDEVTIETVDAKPVVVLREGAVAPLYRIQALCGKGTVPSGMPADDDHIVLVRVGEAERALAVPHLFGRQEIVIKPLSPLFKGLRGLGGATVLGDGRVALILDPRTLFSMEA